MRVFCRKLLFVSLVLLLPCISFANEGGGVWSSMEQGANEPTIARLIEQCENIVDLDPVIKLIHDESCKWLGEEARNFRGRKEETIPDGVIFDFLHGREKSVSKDIRKELGQENQAEVFVLESKDGSAAIVFTWFTGEKTSCNNLAVNVLTEADLAQVNSTADNSQDDILVACQWIELPTITERGMMIYLPGVEIYDDYFTQSWVYIPPFKNTTAQLSCANRGDSK